MNEPYDVEISRALKDSAAKSLEGWEFTPAMRARVMERIRTEAAGTAVPDSPPSRRFNSARVVRPLAWVAVAAAAMVIVVKTDLTSLGGSRKASESKAAPAATSAPAPAPAPAMPVESAGPSAEAQPDNAVFSTTNLKSAPQQPATGMGVGTAVPTAAPQQRMLTFELTVPPTDPQKREEVAHALTAPPERRMAPKMALTVSATSNVSGAFPGTGSVLTLTPFGVKAVDASNATVWERPLADLSQHSIVAGDMAGNAAVANGGDLLYLIDRNGELDRTLHASGSIGQLAWSDDGRVAAVEGAKVMVYQAEAGKPLFAVDAAAGSQIDFAPDGLLAVYSQPSPDSRMLTLVDAAGTVVAKAQPAVAGNGLAVTNDSAVVVAGGQAYDRTGKPLWQLPLQTEGLAALGAEQIVAWNAATVMLVSAGNGREYVWKAEWKGDGAGVSRVVPSPDGRFVVIMAPVEDGAVLWAVSADGRQMMTEKLGEAPVDIGVLGNQIALILPNTVEYRTVPEQ
ncbi:MAG TPA: hypothetical protein VD969_18095 [Symbiobacteriaceae bacterium]|nr:hypothetical protein [Symbiobacteriaceae bacterium]